VRCALELFAADVTVGRVDAEGLRELRRLMEETLRLVEDAKFVDKRGYMLANNAFHEYLIDLTGNATLLATYRSLNVHQLMERVLAGPATAAGDSSAQHQRIVEAYEAGDLEAARAAIVANVETGKRLVLEAIEEAGGVL
jgi:DNA-binding GntR family transcriptional regulator